MTAAGGTTKRHNDGDARHDDGNPRSWDGDCGDGGGNASAMTTTTMGGPGDIDVEAVDRFARAGRL